MNVALLLWSGNPTCEGRNSPETNAVGGKLGSDYFNEESGRAPLRQVNKV